MTNTPSPTVPPDPENRPADSQPPVPSKRRRRRWLLKTVVVVLLLLIVLVALGPTLAGTGPVRNLILGQVNSRINGKVSLGSLSVGWFSPLQLENVRLEQEGNPILEVRHVGADVTVWQALFGNALDLGAAKVQDLSFTFIQYPDGSNNFARLVKNPSTEPLILPAALQAQFQGNLRGRVEKRFLNGTARVSLIEDSTISCDIRDINGLIANKLALNVRDPSGRQGTLRIEGEARLFKDGQFDLAALGGNQTVRIESLNLSLLEPFLPPETLDTLAGLADGSITLERQTDGRTVATLALGVQDLRAAGPALTGDTYTGNLKITLPPTTLRDGRMAIGEGKMLALQTPEGTTYVSADMALEALARMLRGEAPGQAGQIGIYYNYDLAQLAAKLPNTLRLRPEIKLTAGRMDGTTELTFKTDQAHVRQAVSLTSLQGTEGGRTITTAPLTLSADSRWVPAPSLWRSLRDVLVLVDSPYLQLDARGASLAQLKLTASAELARLQQELGQFLDFEGMGIASLTGSGRLTVAATGGDGPSDPMQLQIAGNLGKLGISLRGEEGKATPLLTNYDATLRAEGTLVPGRSLTFAALTLTDSLGLLEVSKDARAPLVIPLPGAASAAASGKLNIQCGLKQLSDLLAARAVAAGAEPAKLDSGALALTLDLAHDAGTTTFTVDGRITNLSQGTAIRNESCTFTANGSADATLANIRVAALDLRSNFLNAALTKPLAIQRTATGMQAGGSLVLSGKLAPLASLAEALQLAPPGTLTKYAGDLIIRQDLVATGSQMALTGSVNIDNLAAGQGPGAFRERQLAITNQIRLDTVAQTLEIMDLLVKMQQTGALGLTLQGRVDQYATVRTLDGVKMQMSYDLAALRTALLPLLEAALAPEQLQFVKDLKVAGVRRDLPVALSGRFPAVDANGKPAATPIKYVRAQVPLGIDLIEYQGVTIQKLELPVKLENGILETLAATPAQCNDGRIDLSGLQLNLTTRVLRLTATRENYALLQNVNIQEKSLAHFLGSVSPLFYGTSRAKGTITVTVGQISSLPLDVSITRRRADPNSIGRLTFNVRNMGIKAPFIDLLAAELNLKSQDGMIPLELREGLLTIDDGLASSAMQLVMGGQTIAVKDTTLVLASNKIQSMDLLIPSAMIPVVGQQKFVKDVITVPVTGTLSSPSFDIAKAAAKSVDVVGGATQLLGGRNVPGAGIIGDILGGGAQTPAQQPPARATTTTRPARRGGNP